jgi:putative ABC transport system permease protein
VALIVCLVALTVAVVSNCAFVIAEAIDMSLTPTGIDERDVAIIQSIGIIGSRQSTSVSENITQLMAVPFVKAAAFGSPPFAGIQNIDIRASLSGTQVIRVRSFEGSQGYQSAMGIKVVAGRAINDSEIPDLNSIDSSTPVLITERLSKRLFGAKDAVGELIYASDRIFRIVGVMRFLRADIPQSSEDELAMLSSQRYTTERMGGLYIIRSEPGKIQEALMGATKKLRELNPYNVQSFVSTFSQLRHDQTSKTTVLAQTLAVLVAILLAITSFSIGALTSFWLKQRQAQIGIRRALGATARQILIYFLVENSLIVGSGAILGALLGIVGNRYAMDLIETPRIPAGFFLIPLSIVLLLSQLFALGPAVRASRLCPAATIRENG